MAIHSELRVLELCAGYGGFSLGLRIAERSACTVCYVEREAAAAQVLVRQMAAGRIDPAPVWSDLRTFDAKPWRGVVDLITAGFPCQPWSAAGKRLGESDERWLWPDIARIVGECRPRFVFLENVSIEAFRAPFDDLRGMGYRVPPAVRISAEAVGAPHRRERWWCLADTDSGRLQSERLEEPAGLKSPRRRLPDGRGQVRKLEHSTATDADRQGLQIREGESSDPRQELATIIRNGWWDSEPGMGRVADGVPDRVDRLRLLGNGVVPLAAAYAWHVLRTDGRQA